MNYPLRDPNPPSSFSAMDHIGDVVLIVIGGYHDRVKTVNGFPPAERVTVVTLTGGKPGTVSEDVMLFGVNQSSQFSEMDGGDIAVCRIALKGKAIAYTAASDYDKQMAQDWIARNATLVDDLRAGAVRNYTEGRRSVAEGLAGGGSGAVAPETARQFTPPATQDTAQDTPTSSTMQSLRDPGEPATPDQTGY